MMTARTETPAKRWGLTLLCAAGLALAGAAAAAPSAQAAAARPAHPDFSGTWASRTKLTPDSSVANGIAINLLDTNWAPLSAGRPEDRKPQSFEEQMEAFSKIVREDRDVFAPRPDRIIRPPYTAEGQEAVKALAEARDALGPPGPYDRCLANNVVGVAAPMQIYQRPDRIAIFTQQGAYRVIHLDRVDRSKLAPGYTGRSYGRWEGARLVVTTTDFAGETVNGWPMSPRAKVTETFSMSPDRKMVTIKTVYEDPTYLKEPMARMTYVDRKSADYELFLTNCVENIKGAAEYASLFGATPPITPKPGPTQ